MSEQNIPNQTNLPPIFNTKFWTVQPVGSTGPQGLGSTGPPGPMLNFTDRIYLGTSAGATAQGTYGIAVGFESGQSNQSINGIGIGRYAAGSTQGDYGIAIGTGAGRINQGLNAIAIGRDAGYENQGAGSIAIGAYAGGGVTAQAEGSILLYSGDNYYSPGTTGFFVSPVRSFQGNTYALAYNPNTYELTYEFNSTVSDPNPYYFISNYCGNFGTTYTTQSTYDIVNCCCSANGQYQYIFNSTGGGGGDAYVSKNFGITFTFSTFFPGLATSQCSASGQYIIASASVSKDHGTSWNAVSMPTEFNCNAMSASGQYILGAGYNTGNIVVSNDFGDTFYYGATGTTVGAPGTCCVSATGQYMAVASQTGTNLYQSNDFGNSWYVTSVPSFQNGVAMSASGQYISYTGSDQNIYVSSSFGSTFSSQGSGFGAVYPISMSASGQYQVCASWSGGSDALTVSTDFGNTWSALTSPSTSSQIPWSLMMSSDGRYMGYGDGSNFYIFNNY